jgi:GTP-binding protein YchF
VDIAGLVKGASKGEGLGNQFLGNIREVDAIIHVVRCFNNDNIVHVEGVIDPVDDKEVIDTELQLKDLDVVNKRVQRLEKMAKTGDAGAKAEYTVMQKLKLHLEEGKNLRLLELSDKENEFIEVLQLLTIKPVIYVANVDEDSLMIENDLVAKLKESVKDESAMVVQLCASLEAQIAEFTELTESGLDKLIKSAYELLNLITYFTVGVQEVRAWTITKGWKAPKAASVIHTDFEKGFIKAEVMKYDAFIEYKSEQACKEVGKLSIEGKEYIVEDGDIMHFRFNV